MNVGGMVVTSKICVHAGRKFWVLSQNVDLRGKPGVLLERHGAIYLAPLNEVDIRHASQQTQIMLAPAVSATHLLSCTPFSVSIATDEFGVICASAVSADK
jgi:hypothetical protein